MTLAQTGHSRQLSVAEILKVPDLNIYEQMICIVLSTYITEPPSAPPSVSVLAGQGRMSFNEANEALQSLVERKILPHRIFREIVGDFGDNRLSWAAKGPLVFLQNHPRLSLDEPLQFSKDDSHTVLSGLQDLKRSSGI
ncbi:hypothetical protein LJK88_10140 [Paenibacillus sp. P26]|nr:hypothetical protein LJK88_10140 [Paenibacillus sp. P26]